MADEGTVLAARHRLPNATTCTIGFVLLRGVILSSQFSNARWALSFGRCKEINILEERADLVSLEAGGIQQTMCRDSCQKPLWGPRQPGNCVCSFPSIGMGTCIWLKIGFSDYKRHSVPKAPSTGKFPFTEKVSWHQEKSCPAN